MSTQAVPQPDAGQFQYVKLPDGSYGKFAANAGDDVIKSAISKDFPSAFAGAASAPNPAKNSALTDLMGNGMPSQVDLNPTAEQHPVAASALRRAGSIAKGTLETIFSPPEGKTETASMLLGPLGPMVTRLVRGQVSAEQQLAPQLQKQVTEARTSHAGQPPVTASDFMNNPVDAANRSFNLKDARAVNTAAAMVNPFASGSVANVNQLQDEGKPQQATGEGITDALALGAGLPGPRKVISGAVRDVVNAPQAIKATGPGIMRALDKGTDALANTLTDPRKTFTETIPRAAGRAVNRAFGKPPAQRPIGQPPLQLGTGDIITPPPADTSGSIPYTPPPVAATTRAERLGLLLPEAPRPPIEMPAVPAAPEPEGLFPAASTVVYDPVSGQSRVQFLTSRADPGTAFNPNETQLLNDPRGAFSRYAQEQDLGGLADPLAAQNPSPITNPIKPPSTLPNWASEVTDWERNDPQHLFSMQDEHGFLNHLRQEEIQQWIAEHDKQPEPFASSGLKTREKGPGLMRNAAETKPAGPTPQVPTEANTQDLLRQSIEQANAKKARTVGQPPGTQASAAQPAAVNGGVSVSAPTAGDEIINIRPQDFIDRTGTSARDMNPESIAQAKEAYSSGQQVEPPEIHFDQDGNVVGADGRHRAMGAAQAGVDRIPVRVKRIGGEAPASGAGLTPDNPVAMSAIPQGGSGTVKTSELSLDPARFQYKTNTDESGVTNQFKDTKTFSRPLAGVTSVWTDAADGKTYVVNGHHRVELANRTGEPTMLIQHLEASSAKNARAQGAIINIAEGRGTAVDAAKFIRDSGMQPGDLSKLGVTLSESKISDGLALSKLDQPLFDKVATGQMPEQRGIAIGQATADPVQQRAIVDLIDKQEAKGRKINNDTVAELGRFVANSGNKTIEQGGLFGPNQQISSLALDKAELSAAVRNGFNKEKAVYGSVSSADKAKTLAAVEGQTIQPEKNAAISQEAGQALELYDKLSVTKGPINDILESVAKDKANGYISAEEAKRTALERIRAEIRKTLGSGPGGSGAGSQTRPGFPAPPK